VVGLRDGLCWFERRPLLGRRILVTRTAEQAGTFTDLLQSLGAETVACPLIEIAPPADWGEIDAAIDALPQTDFLVLTSANAVEHFFARLHRLGRDARALQGVSVVAVGPKTAAAIADRGITADLVPADTRAEGVVELLRAQGVADSRVLYPRAELAREVIPRELAAAGAIVSAPVLYRTVPPPAGGERLREALAAGIDAVTFTSSSTVENFFSLAGAEALADTAKTAVVSIGPQTSAALRRLGMEPTVEAKASTLEGMAEALVDYFEGIRIQDAGTRKASEPA
jgi:uroporphyrinogen III methyltransferase/synthase